MLTDFSVGEALAHEFYASGCRVVLAARRAGSTCLRYKIVWLTFTNMK